jgi:hypothetical protein
VTIIINKLFTVVNVIIIIVVVQSQLTIKITFNVNQYLLDIDQSHFNNLMILTHNWIVIFIINSTYLTIINYVNLNILIIHLHLIPLIITISNYTL